MARPSGPRAPFCAAPAVPAAARSACRAASACALRCDAASKATRRRPPCCRSSTTSSTRPSSTGIQKTKQALPPLAADLTSDESRLLASRDEAGRAALRWRGLVESRLDTADSRLHEVRAEGCLGLPPEASCSGNGALAAAGEGRRLTDSPCTWHSLTLLSQNSYTSRHMGQVISKLVHGPVTEL
jgi:hypothetical protein